jgi:tetratricopeptide (TPR) repeat protein
MDPYSVYLYELAARYFLFDDMPEKALEQLKLSVKLDPLWQTSLYSMARIEASLGHKKEMLEYLQRAVEIQKLNGDSFTKSYTNEVFEDSLFQAYYTDTDFLKICPVAIKAPELLVPLYNTLIADDDLYLVIKLGEELLNQHPDRLAILEPMAHALRSINSDLDEHGKDNLYQYGEGEHSIKYFAEYLKKVEDEIVNLRNSGVTSTVYKDVMDLNHF